MNYLKYYAIEIVPILIMLLMVSLLFFFFHIYSNFLPPNLSSSWDDKAWVREYQG